MTIAMSTSISGDKRGIPATGPATPAGRARVASSEVEMCLGVLPREGSLLGLGAFWVDRNRTLARLVVAKIAKVALVSEKWQTALLSVMDICK